MACCVSERGTVNKPLSPVLSAGDEMMELLSSPPLSEYELEGSNSGGTACAYYTAKYSYEVRNETVVSFEISSESGDCMGVSDVSYYKYNASNDTKICAEKNKNSREENYSIKNFSREECATEISEEMSNGPTLASKKSEQIKEILIALSNQSSGNLSFMKVKLSDGRTCYESTSWIAWITVCFDAENHLVRYRRTYSDGPGADEWNIKGYDLSNDDYAEIREAEKVASK